MEEVILELFKKKEINSTPHLGIGQEAVSVGVISNLRSTDKVVGTYRGHVHALMKGVPMESIFAEILGRVSGTNGGYGGPMHLTDEKVGLMGNFSIVGAGMPVAVGLGLASKLRNEGLVTVCFFGDGASNTGYFHEALNMASIYNTPTVFVMENNLYSEHTPIQQLVKVKDLSERSKAYGMKGITSDGNDVVEVQKVSGYAIEDARTNSNPSLVEFRTYRKTGHSARDDESLERPAEERQAWFAKDPLDLCRAKLTGAGVLTKKKEEELLAEVDNEITMALQVARASAWPVTEIKDKVFSTAVVEEVRPKGPGLLNTTMRSAVNIALAQSMRRDSQIVLFGEDVARWGGVYKVSEGLLEEFGPQRVWDTPISEAGMVGMGVGLSLGGFRPIVEIMFADLLLVAIDAIGNTAAKKRWMSGGTEQLPLVIRTACGARAGLPATHTETLEGLFLSLPGIKVVTPSNATDAKGLLCTALRESNPVIFFEHRLLYPEATAVPEDYYTIPLGKANIVKEGHDVTIVSNMAMVGKSLQAAKILEGEGISAEVVDLRCVIPLDEDAILKSTEKTGSLVTIEEGPISGGWSNLVAEKCSRTLEHPLKRIAMQDIVLPYSTPLVEAVVPDARRIVAEIKTLLRN